MLRCPPSQPRHSFHASMMRGPASGTQASGAPMSDSSLPFGVSDSALHVQPQGDNKVAQPTHALPMPPSSTCNVYRRWTSVTSERVIISLGPRSHMIHVMRRQPKDGGLYVAWAPRRPGMYARARHLKGGVPPWHGLEDGLSPGPRLRRFATVCFKLSRSSSRWGWDPPREFPDDYRN